MKVLSARHTVLALVVVLVSLGGSGTPVAGQQRRVIVGYSTSHDFTDFWLERWQERVARETSLQVESRIFDATDTAMRALYAGSVQAAVGGTSFVHRLNDLAITDKLTIIGLPLPGNDYVLVVRPEINTLRDLIGKRVGVASPGSLSDVLPRLLLKRSNIDVNAVRWIRVGGTSARMAALVAGQIDAGIAHAAEALEAEKRGLKPLMAIGTVVDDYVTLAMIVRKSWLRMNDEVARRMVHLSIDAARWAATDKEGYLALAATLLKGADQTILRRAYDVLWEAKIWGVNGLEPAKLVATQQIDYELGDIKTILPLEQWAEMRFTTEYLAAKGRFNWATQRKP